MTATKRLVITTLAALVVAGGGVALGQATDDETPAPAPASAPLSPEDCERLVGPVPEASGGKPDLEEIVYGGECNYGETTLTP